MADIRIADLNKHIGDNAILSDINLSVSDGEYVVVVGPSGCGKSTLLRTVAGLEEATSGSVLLGDREITHLPPAERGIAMVFQSYALYPNMSVRQNLGFALRMAKCTAAEIDAAVEQAAEILDIQHLLDRKPAALSGGQRQRVAIGRAIVRQPDVFLFDEPLSNLDAELRVKMRHEFLRLHRKLKTTTVYVTHDQTEAMTLADRIVVLRAGKIEQVGTPDELYDKPANQFVAGFIGSPQMNFIAATIMAVDAGRLVLNLPQDQPMTISTTKQPEHVRVGETVSLGLRPDALIATDSGTGLLAAVDFVERMGGLSLVHLNLPAGGVLLWQVHGDARLDSGANVSFGLQHSTPLHLFDAGGNRIDTFA